jgi:hypothetical protein
VKNLAIYVAAIYKAPSADFQYVCTELQTSVRIAHIRGVIGVGKTCAWNCVVSPWLLVLTSVPHFVRLLCWEPDFSIALSLEDDRVTICLGHAMAQVVSSQPLTAEARVRARVNPCGLCGGQSGSGTGFSPSSSVFPCQCHSTVAFQTHIIWGMRNMLT